MRWLSNLIFGLPCIVATLVNVTVDDTQGTSIVYTPSDAWNTAADCVGCTAHPDAASMFQNTWHDSTFNPQPGSNNYPNQVLSASLAFKGSAIYVYCALALTTSSPAGNSDMSFLIDGQLSGTFSRPAPGTDGYQYNVLVYSNSKLSPGSHTLTIQNGHVNGPKSLILLDYIIYSFDDGQTSGGTTSSSSSSSTSSTSSTSTSSSSSSSTPVPPFTSTSITQSLPSGSLISPFQTTPSAGQTSALSDSQSTASIPQPTPSSSQSSAHSLSTGAIVGIAVAIPVVLLALLIIFCCYRRRRSEQDVGNDITVYDPSTMGGAYMPVVPVTTTSVPGTRPIGAAAPLLQSPFYPPESTSGSQTSSSVLAATSSSSRSAPITPSGTGTMTSLSQFPFIVPAESTSGSQSQTSSSNWASRPRNIPSLFGHTSISEAGEEEPPPVYEETVTGTKRNNSRLYPREKGRTRAGG